MSEEDEDGIRPARSRVTVALCIGVGIAALAVGAGWIERTPIVAHFVDRAMAERHVPARYRITAIGPFAQRLEDVSIGDPAAPDLTVRRLDLHLGYGLSGPYVAAVEAEGVRLKARLADGKLSLGALDRLMPASSGGPLKLPDLAVGLADTRVALATPAGLLTLALDGRGNLSDGFRGHLAADTPTLVLGGCRLAWPSATIAVAIDKRRPHVTGPIGLASASCGRDLAVGGGRATLDLAFAQTLDRWTGAAAIAGFAGKAPGATFGPLGGSIGLNGSVQDIEGDVRLAADHPAAHGVTAQEALATGHYRYAARAGLAYDGDLALAHAASDPATRAEIAKQAAGLSSTPIGPLITKGAQAIDALLTDAHAAATVSLSAGGASGTTARVKQLALTGRSGGTIRVEEGAGFGWNLAEKGLRADGRLTVSGGGLPELSMVVRQPHAGAGVSGTATLQPYEAGGARLALTPVIFASTGGRTQFDTVATIDGSAGGVRAEGLALPLRGWFGGGAFAVGEQCTPIRATRLVLAGATIENGAFRACGVDGLPIMRLTADGYFGVGMDVHDAEVSGHSGAAPLSLAVGHVVAAPWGFKAQQVSVRLGAPDAQTRLDMGSFDGSFLGGFTGAYADTSGQIGRVPLLLSGAGGDWELDDGALVLSGDLTVSDAGVPPRFLPMVGQKVALKLLDGQITATGTLAEPKSGAKIADVSLHHDLARGTGGAVLSVPALTFAPKGLQPDALTPLTLGVIANVAGTVSGSGRIDWTANGVTSSGDFSTDKLDLAAAFGPVAGIAGKIHFTDLLGLATPPHQEATIADINPGVAVDQGVVHYQLLPGFKVAVEDARWPFAGGTLTLDPSVLAFDATSERDLTFRVTGLDAGAFVNELALPNLNATGVFDGTLPMIFDIKGGRIEGGSIVARKPGGTIAYVGELSQEQVGMMGKIAFNALKAIRYRSLAIGLDGRLDGEIISRVQFDGIRQATPDANLLARMLHNLPFRFNISIRAPFRSLVGTARSYYDPSLLLQGGVVPGTIDSEAPQPSSAPTAAIQPPVSETVR